MSLLHFPDDNCTLKWRISDSDVLFQASNIYARTWSSCKPPLFPALSDSLCILLKTLCHRLCLWELLKLVSKLEFMFYEEVDRWGGEKFPLGQGHWKPLTGHKSYRLNSTSLTVLHKKSAWKLFSCLSLQNLSGHPWSQHLRVVYFITVCYPIDQDIYSQGISTSPGISIAWDIWDVTTWYHRGNRCLLEGKATSGCVSWYRKEGEQRLEVDSILLVAGSVLDARPCGNWNT